MNGKKMFRGRYSKGICIFLAIAVAVAVLLILSVKFSKSTDADAIVSAEYPVKENMMANIDSEDDSAKTFINSVSAFSYSSCGSILKEDETGENQIYSPLSLYMAMSMVGEITDGSTRQEILDALYIDSIDELRYGNKNLLGDLYFKNEIGQLTLANSIWLQKGYDFKKEAFHTLADNYYASSYDVDFKDKNTSSKIADWVYKNTGGKFGKSGKEFETSDDQIMMLLNTVYFYDEWDEQFMEQATSTDKFYLKGSGTVSCDYMNMTTTANFYRGDNFKSSSLRFKNGCSMVFILPDEGVSPYLITSDAAKLWQAVDFMANEGGGNASVIYKIPKFKFDSSYELINCLRDMGINSIFTDSGADFSPISNSSELSVSKVKQAAYISIDEKGCEAAAYTRVDVKETAMALPEENQEMILDRPFITAITTRDGMPLFIGVINNPSK